MVNLHYVDQFGGYAADFGTYMEAYSLRTIQDVEDVLSYIESLPTAFESYLTYAQDRADAGYPLSDYTIDEMVGYLQDVVDQGEDYYLTDIIVKNVNNCEFLDETQRASYAEKVEKAMKDSFLPAYTNLAEQLPSLKGKCEKEGYLAAYGEVGKAQFVYDLKSLLGMPDLDMEEYGAYLKDRIDTYSKKLNQQITKLNNVSSQAYNKFMAFYDRGQSIVGIEDPNEMIEYLKREPDKRLHLVILLSDGGVSSHIEHLKLFLKELDGSISGLFRSNCEIDVDKLLYWNYERTSAL